MGLTSRRKRPLDRSIPHFHDTRLIIIATEGRDTEKLYFESDLFHSRRVQVRVLPTDADNKSAPNHVLNRLREFAREYDLQPNDQLWLMVDKDRWNRLAEVCSHAVRGRKYKASLAISNPCFELWLYLHHADWTDGPISSRDMEAAIRSRLGSYNKSNIDIDMFRAGIDTAIERANAMDTQSTDLWPKNPGTHVYKVVIEIIKLTSSS